LGKNVGMGRSQNTQPHPISDIFMYKDQYADQVTDT